MWWLLFSLTLSSTILYVRHVFPGLNHMNKSSNAFWHFCHVCLHGKLVVIHQWFNFYSVKRTAYLLHAQMTQTTCTKFYRFIYFSPDRVLCNARAMEIFSDRSVLLKKMFCNFLALVSLCKVDYYFSVYCYVWLLYRMMHVWWLVSFFTQQLV